MAQAAARVLHAEWCGEDVLFTGVSTDSRSVKSGDLFIALSGKNFDGHKFVTQAKDRGAVAAMVNQESDICKRYPARVRATGSILAGVL